jgi:hypothetical protein
MPPAARSLVAAHLEILKATHARLADIARRAST